MCWRFVFVSIIHRYRIILILFPIHQYLLLQLTSMSEEEYEALCKLLTSVGAELDHERAKSWMDGYFTRLETFLASRMEFMCIFLQLELWG